MKSIFITSVMLLCLGLNAKAACLPVDSGVYEVTGYNIKAKRYLKITNLCEQLKIEDQARNTSYTYDSREKEYSFPQRFVDIHNEYNYKTDTLKNIARSYINGVKVTHMEPSRYNSSNYFASNMDVVAEVNLPKFGKNGTAYPESSTPILVGSSAYIVLEKNEKNESKISVNIYTTASFSLKHPSQWQSADDVFLSGVSMLYSLIRDLKFRPNDISYYLKKVSN